MTVDGNTIKCDAYGCGMESHFGVIPENDAPAAIRRWFGLDGWRLAGDEGQLDFCPQHC